MALFFNKSTINKTSKTYPNIAKYIVTFLSPKYITVVIAMAEVYRLQLFYKGVKTFEPLTRKFVFAIVSIFDM